jgi:hypothetical protein
MRRGGSTRPAGLPISEVISEGNVGLMQGTQLFVRASDWRCLCGLQSRQCD